MYSPYGTDGFPHRLVSASGLLCLTEVMELKGNFGNFERQAHGSLVVRVASSLTKGSLLQVPGDATAGAACGPPPLYLMPSIATVNSYPHQPTMKSRETSTSQVGAGQCGSSAPRVFHNE